MSGHPSIRRQITWRLVILFAGALILSAAIFLHETWVHRVDNHDRSLRRVASQLAKSVERDASGKLGIRDAVLGTLQIAEISSLRYAATDQATGAIAEGSMPGLIAEIAKVSPAMPSGSFDFADADGVSERGYRMAFETPVGTIAVFVASPNLSLADTLAWMQDETLKEFLPVLAPLFFGALLIAPLTIRHSLRPLDRLAARAALIEPAHTDVRLPEDGVPSEILPLVTKVNEALARIDAGFEQQRRFTSNAAHELRTPLAILRARIDGLEEGPIKSGLTRDLERMVRLVGQLLLAGRLDIQPPALDKPVDLVEVARETAEHLAPLRAAQEHELKLLLPQGRVEILGDMESLRDALRNLIDNALSHSPAGAPVEIEVTGDGAIEVRDRGRGIPAEDRQAIFEPFWRGKKSTGDGAGLGLSIVQAIVASHRGAISVGHNPGGGAVFRLQFSLLPTRPVLVR